MIDWQPIEMFEPYPYTQGSILVCYRYDGTRQIGVGEFRMDDNGSVVVEVDGHKFWLSDSYPRITHWAHVNMP